jgi:hypothetical protein
VGRPIKTPDAYTRRGGTEFTENPTARRRRRHLPLSLIRHQGLSFLFPYFPLLSLPCSSHQLSSCCCCSISCSIVRAVQIRLTRPLVVQMNKERLMKMAGAVRTGGKGTMRRYALSAHGAPSYRYQQKKCNSSLHSHFIYSRNTRAFVQEEEGCPQDGHHGRQEAAEHAQESRGQHHPRNRGGQHLQGRPRHPVLEPQRSLIPALLFILVVRG